MVILRIELGARDGVDRSLNIGLSERGLKV